MYHFYSPEIRQQIYQLNEQESQHCIKVLRKSLGDLIYITDGLGTIYQCQITGPHPKHCSFEILSQEESQLNLPARICMAIAPTKSIDRFEWFLEKAVELGVTEILPIICEHSERKVLKHDRLLQIMTSAMKQSLSARLPVLNPAASFIEALSISQDYSNRLIAYCGTEEKSALHTSLLKQTDTCIFIGPEGDFSASEISLARAQHVTPVSFGERRLRTETAALYALQLVHFVNLPD